MSEQNWAGTYTYRAPIVQAGTVEEVRRLVRAGGRVRALGTRHSFNDLPDTDGTLVGVTSIDPGFVLDEAARTVEVGAGTRYGILARWLHERGWALHNLGSLPHISVGGATATGTHGSGVGNGVLTTAIRAIEYVDATGELARVAVGDADFEGMAVGLGAYGVVVRLTLAIEPTYRVRQDVYTGLRWDAALDDLPAVTGAGYSVSLFTRWTGDEVGQLWIKTRLAADDDPVVDELLGARRGEGSANSLGEDFGDNLTEQGGVPGPWLERLPHFRLDSTPSNGDEIQTEYFVAPADAVPALQGVRSLADRIAPHLLVSELRTAAPDRLWLSGAYERGLFAIHFTWRNEPDAVRAVLPEIEQALADFAPRPHWGKLHTMRASDVDRSVPRLADARGLFERLDPEGVFTNDSLERVGVRARR